MPPVVVAEHVLDQRGALVKAAQAEGASWRLPSTISGTAAVAPALTSFSHSARSWARAMIGIDVLSLRST